MAEILAVAGAASADCRSSTTSRSGPTTRARCTRWRERFHARLADVRAQGFDDRFIRMWDLYLGYCEAAFLERHIGDVQLLLAKSATRRVLFDEPWNRAPALTAARAHR